MGGPEERQIFTEALADFARLRPNIRVRYTQIPGAGYDYFNKLRLMLVAGLAPDVFYVPDGNFGSSTTGRPSSARQVNSWISSGGPAIRCGSAGGRDSEGTGS